MATFSYLGTQSHTFPVRILVSSDWYPSPNETPFWLSFVPIAVGTLLGAGVDPEITISKQAPFLKIFSRLR